MHNESWNLCRKKKISVWLMKNNKNVLIDTFALTDPFALMYSYKQEKGRDMKPHYNQDYSREEIEDILAKIKACVSAGKYTISLNERRQENVDFINEYNIRSDKQNRFCCK